MIYRVNLIPSLNSMSKKDQKQYHTLFKHFEVLKEKHFFPKTKNLESKHFLKIDDLRKLAEYWGYESIEGSMFQKIRDRELDSSEEALNIYEEIEYFSNISNTTSQSYDDARHQNPFNYHQGQQSKGPLKRKLGETEDFEASTPYCPLELSGGSVHSGRHSHYANDSFLPPAKRSRTLGYPSYERHGTCSNLIASILDESTYDPSFKEAHQAGFSFDHEKVTGGSISSGQISNHYDNQLEDDFFEEQLGNEGVLEDVSHLDETAVLPDDLAVEDEDQDNDSQYEENGDISQDDDEDDAQFIARPARILLRLKAPKVAKALQAEGKVRVAGRKKAATWNDAEHVAIETLIRAERALEEANGEKPKKDLNLYNAISRKLGTQYGIDRNFHAAKNYWNRFGRERSGFEERIGGSPHRSLVASAQKTKKMQRK